MGNTSLIENFQPLPSFWAPTGLRKLFHVAFSKGDHIALGDPVLADDRSSDTLAVADVKQQNQPAATLKPTQREKGGAPGDNSADYNLSDPDAGPPTNPLQKLGRLVSRFYSWSGSAEGLYCWKYTVISVALWMPMVFHHSAYFTYTNRGLWGLIMAQTGLGIYGMILRFMFWAKYA